MRGKTPYGSVSAVIATMEPNAEHMVWTLDRLAEQDYPIREVVVVDSSDPPIDVEVDDIPTKVLHRPDLGIAAARKAGANVASGDYIIDMDEDAVFLRDDYVSTALEKLQDAENAAAGGAVYPIRGNKEGKAIAFADRFNPFDLGTHNLVYPRRLCSGENAEVCFPMDGRGEDLTIRRQVRRRGNIVRMSDQPILKDLPTTRQEDTRNTLLGTIAGGVIAGIGSSIAARIVGIATDEGTELLGIDTSDI